MQTRRWLFAVFLTLSLPMVFPADAHALFQLSVSPRRGGQNIRFESAEPGGLLRNEEVTVGVTTDLGVQYQILQTLYQPLTNELGNTLPISAFVEFSPSTPAGTLRTQLETPLTMGQKQIYTSNTTGESDEFVLVFNVRVPENQPGGVYHTQLTFTADPVNARGGVSPSTTTLDMRVEITPKFRITIENSKGSKAVDLGRITREKPQSSDRLLLQIESNIGTRYRLLQQLTDIPVSPQGDTLEEGTLTYSVNGGVPQTLPQSPTEVFASNEWGASERLQIEYLFLPAETQKAGIYSGSLSFRVESNSPFVTNEVINIPIKLVVDSIFSLETQTDSSGSMNFGTFRTGDEIQQKRVVLKVHSNLGEPYQIFQVVPRKMTNEQGAVLPKEHFQFYAQDAKTGALAVPSPAPVQEGETLVFTSDRKGTPEQFVLNYELTVPKGAKAGSYHSELKYSVTTL